MGDIKNLERKRYSIITNDLTVCYWCGRPKDDLHEIFGGSNRILSMEDGMVVPLCRLCHEKVHLGTDNMYHYFHRVGQKAWMQKYAEGKDEAEAIEAFRARYGKSYL